MVCDLSADLMRWALLLILSGCATPYAEVGVGYKIHSNTYGSNPTAHIEVGLEWDKGVSCGISHWSHYQDGPPFNNRYESFKDELVCKKRWGGK